MRETKSLRVKASCYRVTVAKPPQILIASESKLREWLGNRGFERLMEQGKVEKLEVRDDGSLVLA